MNPQRSCDENALNDVRTSIAAIRTLTHEILDEHKEAQLRPAIKGHFYTILAHTNRIFALLGEPSPETALCKTTQTVPANPLPTYRVMEEIALYDGSPTETAMVVARPSLLQLVTDHVPAIDLDNRHQLMRAIFEMLKRPDGVEAEPTSTAIQPQAHIPPTPVTIVDLPTSRDTEGLRNLFLARRHMVKQEL